MQMTHSVVKLCSLQSNVYKRLLVHGRHRHTGHPECTERPRNPFIDPEHEHSITGSQPRSYIGRKHLVTMAKGVGVGPELMTMVKRVFLAANAPVEFEELDMSGEEEGDVEMENLIYSVERNGVCIKGNIEKALTPTEMSRNMQMRRALDLYVNVIEIKSYPAITEKTRLKKEVDMVLVRQNTEGEFSMLEHDIGCGIENLKITTEYNSRRQSEFTFNYAVKNRRRKVICLYNREVMNDSESLFVETASAVASRYPDVEFTVRSLHDFANRMHHFEFNKDVLMCGVMNGGIILSLLFGLLHVHGLYCGQNLGSRYAVFEPAARHKGYKLTNQNKVNPVGALECGVMLLRHLEHYQTADRIQRAIERTINEDGIYTEDVYGVASTSEMVSNIERRIRETMPEGYRDSGPPTLPPTPPPTSPFSELK